MTGWNNEKKEILIQNLESKGVHSHILAKKDIPALQNENQVGNSILKSIHRIISPEPTDYYEGPYYWQEIKEYARSIKAEVLIAYSLKLFQLHPRLGEKSLWLPVRLILIILSGDFADQN